MSLLNNSKKINPCSGVLLRSTYYVSDTLEFFVFNIHLILKTSPLKKGVIGVFKY